MNRRDMLVRHRQLERLEAASDPLIDALGYIESFGVGSPAYDDARFVMWLAREGGMDQGEGLDGAQIAGLVRRIRAAAIAQQCGLQLVDGLPEIAAVPSSWPVSSAIAELGRHRQAAVVDLAIAAGTGRELWDVECEGAVPVPGTLPRGEYLALTVSGDSMDPLLHSGDLVLLRRGDEVKSGSIVVMHAADAGYVVKRVGHVEPRWVELLSVNPSYEQRRVRRTRSAVLGTVLLRWCSHDAAH